MIPTDRPVVVTIAGPNGAGKSTFYEAFLSPSGLRFVNAGVLSKELCLAPYDAARVAAGIREQLVRAGESFIFETVFSDPNGEKASSLVRWRAQGYTVVLIFIGLANAGLSDQRVAMRVSRGGHDVPPDKVRQRFPRILANLRKAVGQLPYVYIYDNSDLRTPYRRIAVYEEGLPAQLHPSPPAWLTKLRLPRPPARRKPRWIRSPPFPHRDFSSPSSSANASGSLCEQRKRC